MRAAILTELNQPLTVAALSSPALGVGQVRVHVEYAAICGAQLGEIAAPHGLGLGRGWEWPRPQDVQP